MNRRLPGRTAPVAALALAGVVALLLPSPPASAEGSDSPAPSARHHLVEIRRLVFEPAELALVPGDTVTWTNRDIVPHTVTGDGGSWGSEGLEPGGRYTLVVEEAHLGGYACLYHPTMTGRMIPQ